METVTIQHLVHHVVHDVTPMITELLKTYRRGSNPSIDELLSVRPLPDDFLRLAEDNGTTFVANPNGDQWVAIRDGVIVETVTDGSVYDCARAVCETYRWTPQHRRPAQYWIVSSYLAQCINYVGGTVVTGGCMNACVWVRETSGELSSDEILLRVLTDVDSARKRMPRMISSSRTPPSPPQAISAAE